MTLRQRKFIGMVAIVTFLIVYCLIAMAIGGMVAVGLPLPLEIGFFVLAGIGWLPVVMIIIRWMSRPA
ncbi:DUF2842 domain-containing protein [Taklimakanibacter albus]|uniref:DUF2842 domain-containing protein n=1 Tax=Taklimakanibacter albus TaxID=2800327 RepID=A0ACC5R1Q7_9HYPH|nr:DUF2842 domain-containing protein [Aestuariivirga sp. YIM B02566]MBK1866318.1 DUF2842 domain-containing protein [Aestuariivirga sp. YIM B02566]